MERYEKGAVLGVGTFGEVFKATDKQTGKVVAIKKIRITEQKEGINVTALREIKLLKELSGSPSIVSLVEAFPLKKNVLLVFEFMMSDLEAIIKDRSIILSLGDIKAYIQMILQGLQACHSKWVIHRDVKPNNFLVAPDGSLKLADFGLSRLLLSPEHHRPYTNQVFARWYRAPELLYGSTCYGFAPDIWAAGCIFAELLLRRPWLPGDSDIDQLGRIFQALGTPTEETWPGVTKLPGFVEYQASAPPPLRSFFPKATDDALDLLSRMVCLDPKRRATADEALAHRYFRTDPLPTAPGSLPKPTAREDAPLQASSLPGIQISQPSSCPPDKLIKPDAGTGGKSPAAGARSPQPVRSPSGRPSKRHHPDRRE
mmetsp:Transcript_42543/g.127592  ORF Transcript_42543/g.127592 Transcript_42543/m.127592 type:complete len:371 (-) Transcript_42543:442-1554(-)